MILGRELTRPDGTKRMQRMVFKNISADEFDWSWEGYKDGATLSLSGDLFVYGDKSRTANCGPFLIP